MSIKSFFLCHYEFIYWGYELKSIRYNYRAEVETYNEISLLKKQVLSLANVYELCKQKVNKILKGQKRLTKKFVQL